MPVCGRLLYCRLRLHRPANPTPAIEVPKRSSVVGSGTRSGPPGLVTSPYGAAPSRMEYVPVAPVPFPESSQPLIALPPPGPSPYGMDWQPKKVQPKGSSLLGSTKTPVKGAVGKMSPAGLTGSTSKLDIARKYKPAASGTAGSVERLLVELASSLPITPSPGKVKRNNCVSLSVPG